jgi:ketosteroid isomerase-like protein
VPATTPEDIHRIFEDTFNAGDIDGLMEMYEPDAALIAQPGSIAHGPEQIRTALLGFLGLKGRIKLDTKLAVPVGGLAYLSNTWSLRGTGPDGNPVTLAPPQPRSRGAGPTAPGLCDRQRLGRPGGRRMSSGARMTDRDTR